MKSSIFTKMTFSNLVKVASGTGALSFISEIASIAKERPRGFMDALFWVIFMMIGSIVDIRDCMSSYGLFAIAHITVSSYLMVSSPPLAYKVDQSKSYSSVVLN